MAGQEWTPAIGLRNAAMSLVWRSLVTGALWIGSLWCFHAVLGGIAATRMPMLIVAGFALIAGTIAGLILSRGLADVAGMVSLVLTALAGVFAAGVIVGGEALFAGVFAVATDHLRFLMVGGTMVVALIWIVKNTLLDT